jgi:hypothetical protein
MSQRFNMRVGAEAVIVRDDAILLIPEIADQLLALITTPPTHNPFGEA